MCEMKKKEGKKVLNWNSNKPITNIAKIIPKLPKAYNHCWAMAP